MTEENLDTIKQIVKSILETDERARSSDKFLIWLIFKEYTKSTISYEQFSLCPNFESIRRMRQKLQEENNNLRADEEIEKYREIKKEEYKKFFSQHGVTNGSNYPISIPVHTGDEVKSSVGIILRRPKGIEIEHKIKRGIALF